MSLHFLLDIRISAGCLYWVDTSCSPCLVGTIVSFGSTFYPNWASFLQCNSHKKAYEKRPPGFSPGKASASNVGDPGSISGSGRSSGEGNGNPLLYSCLENPWTEDPGRLQSMGLQRVGHGWADFTHFMRRKEFWLRVSSLEAEGDSPNRDNILQREVFSRVF